MKNIEFKRATTAEQLNQIIALQQQNLGANISIQEKSQEGFVTVQHTHKLLATMNRECQHCIITSNDSVIGYALVMTPRFKSTIKVLAPMFKQMEAVMPPNKNYVVMGQICLAKEYRGQGLFKQLYSYYKQELNPQFDCLITEVASTNTRSLHAHQAVGFTTLQTYQEQNTTWHIMIWDWA